MRDASASPPAPLSPDASSAPCTPAARPPPLPSLSLPRAAAAALVQIVKDAAEAVGKRDGCGRASTSKRRRHKLSGRTHRPSVELNIVGNGVSSLLAELELTAPRALISLVVERDAR